MKQPYKASKDSEVVDSNEVFNKNKLNHYFISSLLTTLAGFISFPILTRLLSKTDYGIYSLIQAGQLFYEAILKSGFQFSIVRQFNHNRHNKLVFVKSLLIFPLSISLIVTILTCFLIYFISFNSDLSIGYILVILAAEACVVISLLRSYMHARGRSLADSIIDIVNKYFYLFLVVPLVLYVSSNYWGVVISLCISGVVTALISLWINRDILQSINSSVDYSLIKESYIYALPLLLTEITILSIAYVDRFVMALMDVELSNIGIYAIGFGLANVIYLLLWKILQPSILPNANVIYDEKGVKHAVQFLEKNANFLLLFFLCLSVAVFLNAKDFIIVLCGSDKEEAFVIFQFAILLFLFKVFSNILFYGFHLNQKTKPVLYSEVCVAVSNIGFNVLLIPFFGMLGALIATFIAFFIGLAMKYFYLEKEYQVRNIFDGLLISLLLMAVYAALHVGVLSQFEINNISRLVVSAVILLTLFLITRKFWVNKYKQTFKAS